MTVNHYFQSGNTSGTTAEQRLVEDLVIESLQIYGHHILYIPRTLVDEDTIFDEDTLSEFTQAYPLEMYLENVEGFDGDGDLFSKFGIEVRDKATFVLAKRRWEENVITTGGTFTQDSRPSEGDLLYFPKTGSLFEIKYVEFQNPFYQLGKIYTFKMECELFEYSSERFNTGIDDIDNIYNDQNLDMLQFEFLLENDDKLLLENFSNLILEEYSATKSNETTDNINFTNADEASDILDFTEINPFGELRN